MKTVNRKHRRKEDRGNVPAHGAALLCLLDLQLGQELHEPLEALLVAIDPEEINLIK